MTNNKNISQTSWEKNKNFSKGLSKIEGILTSQFQLKGTRTNNPYYLAFFQLEGLDQDIKNLLQSKRTLWTKDLPDVNALDIPIIFKVDSSSEPTPPDIPPQAKVILEGHWAEPNNSTRPSFTCLAYEIVSNPPPPTLKSLREQISSLLSTSLDKKQEWTQRTDYLFKKQKNLSEIEKLTRLGPEYLQAYLLLKSASYANYQNNLLPHTADLTNYDHYLTKIAQELTEIAQHIRAYQSKDHE